MAVARDKFWLFGVRPHQDDGLLYGDWERRRADGGLSVSRMTPAEAAAVLDVPNVMMIGCHGEPAAFGEDAYGYAESFCRMKKVYWSSTGSGGFRTGAEDRFICELAKRYPNVCGTFMDDYYNEYRHDPDGVAKAAEKLRGIHENLSKACRPIEKIVSWVWKDEPYPELMQYIDGLTLWTWKSTSLYKLPGRFEELKAKIPDKKIYLGIYLYDFYHYKPVPDDLMEFQCELGLQWLKEGRIEGMVFETNSVMGVRLPSELWVRDWIQRVKDTEVPD